MRSAAPPMELKMWRFSRSRASRAMRTGDTAVTTAPLARQSPIAVDPPDLNMAARTRGKTISLARSRRLDAKSRARENDPHSQAGRRISLDQGCGGDEAGQ